VANGLAAATANFCVTTSALRVKPVAISGCSGALLVVLEGVVHAPSKANIATAKLGREALEKPERLALHMRCNKLMRGTSLKRAQLTGTYVTS
jgi:hypothetical protein